MAAKLGPDVPNSMRIDWKAVSDRGVDPLQRLRAAQSFYVNVRAFQSTLALAARSEGFTWEEIGQALGVTKQAAQQRLGVGVGR